MAAGNVSEERKRDKFLRIGAYGIAIVLLITLICGLFIENDVSLFLAHPVMMTGGVCMFTHGVMAFRAPLLTRPGLTGKNQFEHGSIQIVGYLLFITGFIVIVVTKISYNVTLIPESPHAWAGLITAILATLQIGSGLIKVLWTPLPKGLRVHGQFGLFLYFCAMVSIILGAVRLLDFPLAQFNVATVVIVSLFAFLLGIFTILRRFTIPYPDAQARSMENFMKTFFDNEEEYRAF